MMCAVVYEWKLLNFMLIPDTSSVYLVGCVAEQSSSQVKVLSGMLHGFTRVPCDILSAVVNTTRLAIVFT